MSRNSPCWTLGSNSLSGTLYAFCRLCKNLERTGDVARWKNTCLACTRLWVQFPALHKRTPKCRDAGPPFTAETRKLSLREVMISAESQGKRGTEPGLVVALSPSESAEESGEQPSAPCNPFWKGVMVCVLM